MKPFFTVSILLCCLILPPDLLAQNVGIGVSAPLNKLDISIGNRKGLHATNRPLYVTGNIDNNKNGIEFRLSNGTQGIGFGYNSIYAAGSNSNQKLSFASKGESNLSFITGNRTGMQIDFSGRVIIDADISGPDSVKSSYPLQIKNSYHGISISLPVYARFYNNYITFWDEESTTAKGCIEGQTLQDLLNSLDYIWNTLTYTFAFLQAGAEGLACLPQQDWGEVVSNGIAVVDATTKLAEYVIDAKANVGVSYQSGSADYAEYIEKENKNETFSFGDIVGVSGGKVSKKTSGADHLMVISMAPGVLGNMPLKGREKDFEKVAFLGQAPVKVKGSVSMGDYILPSGRNDGFGHAVSPDKMMPDDFKNIVGIAWAPTYGQGHIQYVNVAVGLNKTKINRGVSIRAEKVDQMKKDISGIVAYLKRKDPSFSEKQSPSRIQNIKPDLKVKNAMVYKAVLENRQKFVSLMKQHPDQLKFLLASLRKQMQKKGLLVGKMPELDRLLSDANYFLEFYERRSKSF